MRSDDEKDQVLDFVHAEVLKEDVPPRGGQPTPHV
jgi:hypothetical protein